MTHQKTWVVKMSTGSIYVSRPRAIGSDHFILALVRAFRDKFSVEPSGGPYDWQVSANRTCEGAWLKPLEG